MTASEILQNLDSITEGQGFQLTKRKGILTSTWLIYKRKKYYYFFDVNEDIVLNKDSRYSKEEWIKEYEHAYFEIDDTIY